MQLLHHRGEPRKNTNAGWIFGIFDEETKNVHFEVVANRTQETLFFYNKAVCFAWNSYLD
jgi:hypothetical protein